MPAAAAAAAAAVVKLLCVVETLVMPRSYLLSCLDDRSPGRIYIRDGLWRAPPAGPGHNKPQLNCLFRLRLMITRSFITQIKGAKFAAALPFLAANARTPRNWLLADTREFLHLLLSATGVTNPPRPLHYMPHNCIVGQLIFRRTKRHEAVPSVYEMCPNWRTFVQHGRHDQAFQN